MKKWSSIQALRGAAVLAVVLYHLQSIEKKYSGGDSLLPAFLHLGQSGVDLFFVISGFVMTSVTHDRFARRGETTKFLWGRFSRIYSTYWVYFLLTASVFLIKPSWVNARQGHQVDLLSSFFLLPSTQLPVVMVAWSLIHELWFYLVFSVFLVFKESLLPAWLLVWAALIVLVNLFIPNSDFSPAVRVAIHPYSLEFIVGAFMALAVNRGGATLVASRSTSVLIAIAAPAGLSAIYAFGVLQYPALLRAIVLGGFYGILVFGFAKLEKDCAIRIPGSIQFLGDISYSVYLSHILVLSALGRLWSLANPSATSLYDNIFVLTFMLAAVVICSWAGYVFVEKPSLKMSHQLRDRLFLKPDRRLSSAEIPTGRLP